MNITKTEPTPGGATRVASTALTEFVRDIFWRCGVSAIRSERAADVLVFADRRGVPTHGVANLSRIYVKGLQDGRIDPHAVPLVGHDAGAVAVLDARRGLGLAAGAEAMDLAVDKARRFGVGAVAVRNSTHFGAAGYYAHRAQARGVIGIAMSNLGTQAVVPPPGGSLGMTGTNPLAFGAPAAEGVPPFVLDMSVTVTSAGQVRRMAARQQPVPLGWLVDLDGKFTTDPSTYDRKESALAFLGGTPETGAYKGFGLALMVETLAGVLSGAGVGPRRSLLNESGEADSDDDKNIGHFFLALDVAAFGGKERFETAMAEMLVAIADCPSRAPGGRVTYPGFNESTFSREDIALDAHVAKDLMELAQRFSLHFPKSNKN